MIGSLTGIILEGLWEAQIVTETGDPQATTMALSLLLPTLITNSVTTLTIGSKAWIYRCTFRKNPEVGRAHQFFLLFLKSGLLYIVIWAVYFSLLLLLIPSVSIGIVYLNIIVGYLLVLYPVLIIILVTQKPPPLEDKALPWCSLDITGPSQRSTVLDIGPNNTWVQFEPSELFTSVV
ncbi:hypothetical protein C8J56DRAFT_951429 [Mycena floridula]|nr:hypothetical protein C8J56DRAFT_951429 [Mycena floridula]